jgi:hypothetical protein
MKIERVPNRAVVRQIPRISVDGTIIDLPDDFEELLGALVEADGMALAVGIRDEALKRLFERVGFIKANVRDGWYGTAKLRRHKKALEAAARYRIALPRAEPPECAEVRIAVASMLSNLGGTVGRPTTTGEAHDHGGGCSPASPGPRRVRKGVRDGRRKSRSRLS